MIKKLRADGRKGSGMARAAVFALLLPVFLHLLPMRSVYGFGTSFAGRINRFFLGEVKTNLVEVFEGPVPFGEEEYYRKEIYAENTGTVPCYVRFFLDFSEASARDGAKLSRDGENYWDYASFQGIDSADWLVEDGWFYYRRALAPGERTGWLLKSVILPAELKGQKVTLLVYEESAHALNGAPEDCRRAFGKED